LPWDKNPRLLVTKAVGAVSRDCFCLSSWTGLWTASMQGGAALMRYVGVTSTWTRGANWWKKCLSISASVGGMVICVFLLGYVWSIADIRDFRKGLCCLSVKIY